jgi:hypothetical protein
LRQCDRVVKLWVKEREQAFTVAVAANDPNSKSQMNYTTRDVPVQKVLSDDTMTHWRRNGLNKKAFATRNGSRIPARMRESPTRTGDINRVSGVYHYKCHNAERTILEGQKFPRCGRQCQQPARPITGRLGARR